MPLYEYQCDSCGHRFELIRKFSDPPVETCPKCGGAVQKLVSSPAFQFKGSGWYVTDYAKKSDSSKSETKGEKVETKTETKSEGKSDSTSTETKKDSGGGAAKS
jgi:putative FmdB family regulatory protein